MCADQKRKRSRFCLGRNEGKRCKLVNSAVQEFKKQLVNSESGEQLVDMDLVETVNSRNRLIRVPDVKLLSHEEELVTRLGVL